jgi:hypothetical protein
MPIVNLELIRRKCIQNDTCKNGTINILVEEKKKKKKKTRSYLCS